MDDTTDVTGGADEPGWDVDPDDEIAPAVVMAGSQLRAWRRDADLTVGEFAERIGYGEDLIRKVERGARIARPEYLDMVDQVLGGNGRIAAMKEVMAEARYPRKVRELARMEAQAVEFVAYNNHNIHGLLQSEEYAGALIGTQRPAYSPDEIERMVAARVARHSIFDRLPAPELSFIQEEVTLRRPIGGRMVLRRQLERLLEVAQLRNVEIQVMPTDREDHAGMKGLMEVLKFQDGTALGRCEGDFNSRPVSDPKQLRIIELRYGIIRGQALSPRESLAFIEQVLGET
ncbi:helix-turn-helix transcriptional regulator [Streptomyces sp. CAU 1734]|uniref:helix-turn-helix domain-containing protein n=1 Tax=Streptomyces sp. CAU 1734 TaxID=3140360 RepID=UPI0032618C2E